MSEDFRHHRVSREIIFVPVPVGGSPELIRQSRPPAYKRNAPTHWRPANKPPTKGERTVNFLHAITRQDEEVRRFMQERRSHAG